MEVKPVQPSKAYSPILVTLSGILMEVSPVQPLKAYSSISVMLSGNMHLPSIMYFLYSDFILYEVSSNIKKID